MSAEWYVRHGTQQVGPFIAVQLKELAAYGKISPESFVKRGAGGPWIHAKSEVGLFDSMMHRTSSSRPPRPVIKESCKDYGAILVTSFSASSALSNVFISTIPTKRLENAKANFANAMSPSERPIVLIDQTVISISQLGKAGILLTDRACYHGKKSSAQWFAYSDVAAYVSISKFKLKVLLKSGEEQIVAFRLPKAAEGMEEFLDELTSVTLQFNCPMCGQLLQCPSSSAPTEAVCPNCKSHVAPPRDIDVTSLDHVFKDTKSAATSLAQWQQALPPKESAYVPSGAISSRALVWSFVGFALAVPGGLLAGGVVQGIGSVFAGFLSSTGPLPAVLVGLFVILFLIAVSALAYMALGWISAAIVAYFAKLGMIRNPSLAATIAAIAALIAPFVRASIVAFAIPSLAGNVGSPGMIAVWIEALLGAVVACIVAFLTADRFVREARFCEKCKVYMTTSALKGIPAKQLVSFSDGLRQNMNVQMKSIYEESVKNDGVSGGNQLFSCPICHAGYIDLFANIVAKKRGGDGYLSAKWRFASEQLTPQEVEPLRKFTLPPTPAWWQDREVLAQKSAFVLMLMFVLFYFSGVMILASLAVVILAFWVVAIRYCFTLPTKYRNHASLAMLVGILVLCGVAAYHARYKRQYPSGSSETVDTRRILSDRIIWRTVYDGPASYEGGVSESGKPHGKWTWDRTTSRRNKRLGLDFEDWYWNGEKVTETEFRQRSQDSDHR